MKRQRPSVDELPPGAAPETQRPVNNDCPVRKLTTQLLETYKAINQLYYAQKRATTRKCRVWELMTIVSMHQEMLLHEEPSECWAIFQTQLDRWTWRGNGSASQERHLFNTKIDLLAQHQFAGVGTHSTRAIMMDALDRFAQQLEQIKLQEPSFVDQQGHYMAELGEVLDNGRYVLLGHCGTGAFCKAWQAFDRHHGDKVCVKIIGNKKLHSDQSRREIKILRFLAEQVQQSGMSGGGVVPLRGAFMFRDHQCIVFPMLAYDLYELLKNEQFAGLSLKLVRKFAVQILQTLAVLALPGVQLVHCDLKPENIMVVKHLQTRINVIDFGSSCFCEERGSMYVQSRFYRSPEVLLGLRYNCQIDMWSFGCILFELYTGRPLFTGKNATDQLMKIANVLGQPSKSMLAKRKFFMDGTKEGAALLSKPAPMDHNNRFRALGYAVISNRSNVGDISIDSDGRVTDESFLHFVDLITKCLCIDPDARIKPQDALRHPFISPPQKSRSSSKPAAAAAEANSEPMSASSTEPRAPPASPTEPTPMDGALEQEPDLAAHGNNCTQSS